MIWERRELANLNNAPINPVSQQLPSTNVVKSYKDGEFTGDVADAFFGPIQVKAVIKNSQIVDIEFLQYPNDRPTSIQINEESNKVLRQYAIEKQNSDVDNVTGATQSADGFRVTLESALAQARN